MKLIKGNVYNLDFGYGKLELKYDGLWNDDDLRCDVCNRKRSRLHGFYDSETAYHVGTECVNKIIIK